MASVERTARIINRIASTVIPILLFGAVGYVTWVFVALICGIIIFPESLCALSQLQVYKYTQRAKTDYILIFGSEILCKALN